MRIRHFALTVLVLLLGLAACMKDEPENTDDPVNNDSGQTEEFESTPTVFTATVLNFNTATTATTGTRTTVDGGWEDIVSVAVMIDNTVKEYIVWASANDDYTNATLRSDDPHYWTSSDDITVTAWWPYTEGETSMPDVVVKPDQSTADGFENSDFISAEQIVTYSAPTLNFTHRTARVTVNLVAGDGITSVDGATVSLINLSEENGNPSTITPYDAGSDTYAALVAPQTITADSSFIQVKLDRTFPFSPENDIILNAGYHYTYTIKVNATGLTLVGSTIGEWESGNSDENGSAKGGYIYDSDTGTYTVYTADGLLVWNEAAQTDLELNCTLAAHIDLTDKDWTPIGNETNPYTGTFEGCGYSITGLTVNKGSTDYVGLIGGLGSDGKVQNLTLYNVSITGSTRVGGVVGINSGIVTDCTISGNVSGSSGYVGGVAGFNYGTITACYSTGSVSGSASVGGVVGYSPGTIINCSASGSVTGDWYIGGVVGWNYGTVTACTSSGSISSRTLNTHCFTGGVVGQNNGTVTACYSTCSVSGPYEIGGVVGRNGGIVTACYHATGSVSGYNNVGGVVGWNYGTVTKCYYDAGSGIGTDYGSGNAIIVDGLFLTWKIAVNGMNDAIDTWNKNNSDKYCYWKYELTGNLPTLKKVDE